MKPLLIREVQLAHALGYTSFEAFRRDLKRGEIPPPNEYQAGKPVWYAADLERRYGGGMFSGEIGVESRVFAAIEGVG